MSGQPSDTFHILDGSDYVIAGHSVPREVYERHVGLGAALQAADHLADLAAGVGVVLTGEMAEHGHRLRDAERAYRRARGTETGEVR